MILLAGCGSAITPQPEKLELAIHDSFVEEGDEGVAFLWFPVTLSRPFSQTVVVEYATNRTGTATGANTDGQFPPPGSDYALSARNAELIFYPGQTRRRAWVKVYGDESQEDDETLGVAIFNSVNAPIADRYAVGTIINDD